MLNFPASPALNATYAAPDGSQWKWDSAKWINVVSSSAAVLPYLPLTGGTLTGTLDIAMSSPTLYLTKAVGTAATIYSRVGANFRWGMFLGTSEAESGSNAGSNFYLVRYDDSGAAIGNVLVINRASGAMAVPASTLTVGSAIASGSFVIPTTGHAGTIYATTLTTRNWVASNVYLDTGGATWRHLTGTGTGGIFGWDGSVQFVWYGTSNAAINASVTFAMLMALSNAGNLATVGSFSTGLGTSGIGKVSLNPGDTTASGYVRLTNQAGTSLGYLGFEASAPGFTIEAGGTFFLRGGSFTLTNGQVLSKGAGAMLAWDQRDNAGIQWAWYSTAGAARLWHSANSDRVIIDSASNLSLVGGNLFAGGGSLYLAGMAFSTLQVVSGGYTYLSVPDTSGIGVGGLLLGGPTVGWVHYYRAQTHQFENWNGTAYFAIFNTAASYNPSGAWVVYSDQSLKDNIEPYKRGLDAILALEPVWFTYKRGTPFAMPEDEEEPVRIGLIAQQVEPHIPEIVGRTVHAGKKEKTSVATLNPTHLIFVLINAVKELHGQVTELVHEIDQLKSRMH